jgi:hypothetical protein
MAVHLSCRRRSSIIFCYLLFPVNIVSFVCSFALWMPFLLSFGTKNSTDPQTDCLKIFTHKLQFWDICTTTIAFLCRKLTKDKIFRDWSSNFKGLSVLGHRKQPLTCLSYMLKIQHYQRTSTGLRRTIGFLKKKKKVGRGCVCGVPS